MATTPARRSALFGVTLLAGCAMLQPPQPPAPPSRPVLPAPAPEARPAPGKPPAAPPRAARPAPKSARPKAIPERPLNVMADCAFRDPNGYEGRLKLEVREARVSRFEAGVTVPRHGACRFELAAFRQTETMPNPVLAAAGSKCQVRIWEQGERVTVAFSSCRDYCSAAGAWERLWPILANARTGECG